jgi:hypothetical protein
MVDVKKGPAKPRLLKGYPSLAAFITSDHDRTTSIYRRFHKLSARNLLYLQSELAELEARQETLDEEDLRGPMDTKSCARNWEIFSARAQDPSNQLEKERMELTMSIRAKIKEYRVFIATFGSANANLFVT